MKKLSLKNFRLIFANSVIILIVLTIFGLSLISYKIDAFSSNELFAIYNGDKSKNNVSLCINVYWGEEYLVKMIDVLEEKNVRATFFVGGCWVASNVDLLKLIYSKGHEIANHGYYHKDHDKISFERNVSEMDLCHKQVKEALGIDMNLFMPPSGAFNKTTLEAADELGYKTIMWTKDTIDWRDHNSSLIISRATENISNGSFILMHPTPETLEALPTIIDILQSKGFVLSTVSDNIGL